MSIQLVWMFYMYSTQSEKQKQKVQLKDTLSVKNGEKKFVFCWALRIAVAIQKQLLLNNVLQYKFYDNTCRMTKKQKKDFPYTCNFLMHFSEYRHSCFKICEMSRWRNLVENSQLFVLWKYLVEEGIIM